MDIYKYKLNFWYDLFLRNIVYAFASFGDIWKMLHPSYCADIGRLLQYFKNISDKFRNILAILQYFHGIFLQYCLNISVPYG